MRTKLTVPNQQRAMQLENVVTWLLSKKIIRMEKIKTRIDGTAVFALHTRESSLSKIKGLDIDV